MNGSDAHLVVADLKAEIERQIGAIRRSGLSSDQARQIVRIEIADDALTAVKYATPLSEIHGMMPRVGPWQFRGVAMYRVYELPDPGWRVINPLPASVTFHD